MKVLVVEDSVALAEVVVEGLRDQGMAVDVPYDGLPGASVRIFRACGIELDPLRHSASRYGRPLDLSAKEFAVLEALLRAQPGVLSAEDLLEQVWDEHANPFTRTVGVTISRLRRRLGEPAVIETVPSVGYRVSGDPDGPP
jgi:DNA-binding response OmpR family regulator